MTTNSPALVPPDTTLAPSCTLSRIYLKDSSFELPYGANIFTAVEPLNVDFAINLSQLSLDGDFIEASLRVTLTAKLNGKTAFIIEVTQCGIFEVKNISPENFEKIRMTYVPAVLSPYVRAALTDILGRATLPQFMLPEIDWGQAYASTLSAPVALTASTTVH
ncbi:MAG: protein-export chaperone SecB [Agitococcus sp.]|nr:protein-export chaperone SecB [Agitococcus sp.]MDO9177083.1 protein-export chaperone SecB [Agitococcus sp.]